MPWRRYNKKVAIESIRLSVCESPVISGAQPVVAKQPLSSELLKRLTTKDEDARMPAQSPPLPASKWRY